MDNTETRTAQRHGQHRDTDNPETRTTQRHGQHWVNNTAKNGQPRDTNNTETRTTLGEQDTEERQTKQKTQKSRMTSNIQNTIH